MELNKDILSLVFNYLGPKDLYQYSITSKTAHKQTVIEWKRRLNLYNKTIRVNEFSGDDRLCFDNYIRIQKNVISSLIFTILDAFRYVNKKLFGKFIRKDLFECFLKIISKTPCLMQMKHIEHDRRQLEDLLLEHQNIPLINPIVERYFQLIVSRKEYTNDKRMSQVFSYGLDEIFKD